MKPCSLVLLLCFFLVRLPAQKKFGEPADKEARLSDYYQVGNDKPKQAQIPDNKDWGVVDPLQFTKRNCPIDSTANAMVLHHRCVATLGFENDNLVVTYEIVKRIQILNKEGFGEATISIPYYSWSGLEAFSQLKAQTLNAGEGGKIIATPVDKKSVFDENTTGNWYTRKFAFPDIKEGSIIEYKYTLKSKSLGALNSWVFQTGLPTLASSVQINSPEYFHYTSILKSTIPLTQNISSQTEGSFLQQTANVTYNQSYYYMKDIPALKEEKYITTMKDYQAKMTFQMSSIAIPGRPVKPLGESWSSVVEDWMNSERFGLLLDGFGDHLRIAKELTKGLTDPVEKMKIIYDHVARKMKWDDSYSILPSGRLGKSYNSGTGNSAVINMILVDMLKAAGLKADPVMVSTRNHGQIQKVMPDMSQFNHVIVMAKSDTGTVFMDAVSAIRPYYLISVNDLNSVGLCMNEAGVKWVDIPCVLNSNSSIFSSLNLDSSGILEGKVNLVSSEYEALGYRSGLSGKTAKDCIKEGLEITDGAEILNAVADSTAKPDQKLKISFTIKTKESEPVNDILYLNPFPVKFYADNPFKMSARTYPVNFGYPFEDNIKLSITIPPNYKVSELPKSMDISLEDGSARFTCLMVKAERNIQINSSLKIRQAEYQPEAYAAIKNLFAKMIDAYNSVIVLEKQ